MQEGKRGHKGEDKVNKLGKPKKCPFCNHSYAFRTFGGLVRHVQFNHLYDVRKKWCLVPIDAKYLGIETPSGIRYIDIKGWDEVEEFLEDYVQDFNNPSRLSSRLWKYVK